MLQILQRLQQHEDADEAESVGTASDTAVDHDLEISEHMQQKLSMAVCVCMKHFPAKHIFSITGITARHETQATKLDLASLNC